MAVDHPVINLPTGRWPQNSRAFELGVVVALTVAVVVVAALWGTSGQSLEPTGQGSEAVAVAPAATPEAKSDVAEPSATQATQAAETDRPALAVATTPDLSDAAAPALPSQTGIVPGRPDPSGPALPDSFEWYQVQRGESLFAIAGARGVTVSDLLLWNWHLDEDSTLIRGEWIWIPKWDESAVADESGPLAEEGKSGRGGG